MTAPRIVVVEAEGPEGHRDAHTVVGVVPFTEGTARFLGVVVKLALATRDAEGRPVPAVRLGPPPALSTSDFAPPDAPPPAELPAFHPVVSAETPEHEDLTVPMMLEALVEHAGTGELHARWRGRLALARGPEEVERVVVSLEHLGREREAAARLSDLQRGSVRYAWTAEDVAAGTTPPEEDEVLEMARYATWATDAPEPRVELATYARVSAEIDEQPGERTAVLARHRFEERRWLVEERAWLEAMARAAAEGDTELLERHGDLYRAAQDDLARPAEQDWSLEDYARIRVGVERAIDPMVVLGAVPMTLAQWLRLDRRWSARAEAEPPVAADLTRLLTIYELITPDPLEAPEEDPSSQEPSP